MSADLAFRVLLPHDAQSIQSALDELVDGRQTGLLGWHAKESRLGFYAYVFEGEIRAWLIGPASSDEDVMQLAETVMAHAAIVEVRTTLKGTAAFIGAMQRMRGEK